MTAGCAFQCENRVAENEFSKPKVSSSFVYVFFLLRFEDLYF